MNIQNNMMNKQMQKIDICMQQFIVEQRRNWIIGIMKEESRRTKQKKQAIKTNFKNNCYRQKY